MEAINLEFPVICRCKNTIFTSNSLDALTETTTAAIRSGLFDGLKIIDSTGNEYTVENIRRLQGIGPLWGFNIFLNRKMRIEIELKNEVRLVDVNELRRIVFDDFREWHGWATRGDFYKLKKAIKDASTVSEIIRLVAL
jgi:hypothetical protein